MNHFEIWNLFSCVAGRPLFSSDHITIIHGTINSKMLCASTFYVLQREVVETIWDEFPRSYKVLAYFCAFPVTDALSLWTVIVSPSGDLSMLSVLFPLETPCRLFFILSLKILHAFSAILFTVARERLGKHSSHWSNCSRWRPEVGQV